MSNRKREQEPLIQGDVRQCFGQVVATAGARWVVRLQDGVQLEADRAVSCLVEPKNADRVVVALGEKEVYILAVVAREGPQHIDLVSYGDMNIKATSGALRFVAKEALEMLTTGVVNIASTAFDLKTGEGKFALRNLSVVGVNVYANLENVKSVGKVFDSLVDRFTQKVKNSYRFVEETDTLRAENIFHNASETYHLRARNTLTHAEKLVRVDGEQIQLG